MGCQEWARTGPKTVRKNRAGTTWPATFSKTWGKEACEDCRAKPRRGQAEVPGRARRVPPFGIDKKETFPSGYRYRIRFMQPWWSRTRKGRTPTSVILMHATRGFRNLDRSWTADVDMIHGFLSTSYWAQARSLAWQLSLDRCGVSGSFRNTCFRCCLLSFFLRCRVGHWVGFLCEVVAAS